VSTPRKEAEGQRVPFRQPPSPVPASHRIRIVVNPTRPHQPARDLCIQCRSRTRHAGQRAVTPCPHYYATDSWSPPADNMRGTQAPPDGREPSWIPLSLFLPVLFTHSRWPPPESESPHLPHPVRALAPRDAERRARCCRPALLQRRDRRA
jgi:hypothetical protein